MIETLNFISASWFERFALATIQNSLFLALILFVLFALRKKDAAALRYIALLGVLKLYLPPIDITIEGANPLSLNLAEQIIDGGRLAAEPLKQIGIFDITIYSVLFLIWATGALLWLCIVFLNTGRLLQQVKLSDEIALPTSESMFRVVKSSINHSPFVIGIFRPTIVIPNDFDQWSLETQRAVLAHEIAHLRQYDHVLNLVQTIAKAINFFNPIVWFFFKKLEGLNEMSCDNEAMKRANLPATDYARELLAVAEQHQRTVLNLNGTIAFSEQFHLLKQRLNYLLSNKEDFKMKNITVALFAVAMIALSLNCAGEKTIVIQTPLSQGASIEPPDFVQVDKDPEFLKRVSAKYPEIAKASGVEARVILKALIGEDGLPKKVMVFKYSAKDTSNTPERQALEQAAIEATMASTFSAAEIGGKKLAVWLMIPYNFKLNTAVNSKYPKLIEVKKDNGATYIVSFAAPLRRLNHSKRVGNQF